MSVTTSIVLKPGDHVLIKGPISKEEMDVLEETARRVGVFFIISKNPRLEFVKLDDLALARYGLKRFSRKEVKGRAGRIS